MGQQFAVQCCGGTTAEAAGQAGPDTETVQEPGSIDPLTNALIVHRKGSLLEFYDVNGSDVLGRGGFSCVLKAIHRDSGQARAVKQISKLNLDQEKINNEIQTMSKMDHPHIIKLYEVFQDHAMVFLIMEMCAGGELLDAIIKLEHFSEKQAARVMEQAFRAVNYLHEKLVCHRDIKPENFLLQDEQCLDTCNLKLIDFGLACTFVDGYPMTEPVGSAVYVAPEVLKRSYTNMCDLWSCGVVLYVLLCGEPPFKGASEKVVLQKVRAAPVKFTHQCWESVSEDALDLVKRLLVRQVSLRSCAGKALNHTWVQETAPRHAGTQMREAHTTRLRGFCKEHKLKQVALNAIARNLTDSEIEEMREVFISMDTNQDGTLSLWELKEGLMRSDKIALPSDMLAIMQTLDADHDGHINYTEFLAATIDKKQYRKESACWEAFRVFDRDGSGTICARELAAVMDNDHLKATMGVQGIEQIMAEIDTNHDGMIDFQEFYAIMHTGSEATCMEPSPRRSGFIPQHDGDAFCLGAETQAD